MLRLAAVLACALAHACCAVSQDHIDLQAAQRILGEAKQKLAPDRRTVVFDVEVGNEDQALVLSGTVHDARLKGQLIAFFGGRTDWRIEDRLEALPSAAVGEKTFGVVSLSVANLRSKPGHEQELGTQALLGTPLRVLDRKGGWRYVQTPNDYLCWTDDRIAYMTPAQFAAWQGAPKVMVTETHATVRTERTVGGAAVGDVVAGCILRLEGQRGDWYSVGYPDGRTGFLPRSVAAPLDEWLAGTKPTPDLVIRTARRFMGVPYLWGGTSCKAMDCSGFTSTVYFLNGVLLPRDASQQVRVGIPVEIGEDYGGLEPGDLLFFGRAATAARSERVTHVGISLGGMRFIHSAGDVRENSFDRKSPDYSDYRRRHLLHARRILGAGEDVGVRRLKDLPWYRIP